MTLISVSSSQKANKVLTNAFYATYLRQGSMDFSQVCTDILWGDEKELIRRCWHWFYFQGHRMSKIVKNIFSRPCLPKREMDCNRYISWRCKNSDLVLVTSTIFARSQEVKTCWKMPVLHSMSLRGQWRFTKPAQTYHCEMQKSQLELVTLMWRSQKIK